MTLRHGSATYKIQVENPDGCESGATTAELDGKAVDARPIVIPLIDDGATRRLRVVL